MAYDREQYRTVTVPFRTDSGGTVLSPLKQDIHSGQ